MSEQAGGPAAGHSYAARGPAWWGSATAQAGSITSSTTPGLGGHADLRARCPGRARALSPRLGQATDLAVSQAVIDQGEELRRRPRAILLPRRAAME